MERSQKSTRLGVVLTFTDSREDWVAHAKEYSLPYTEGLFGSISVLRVLIPPLAHSLSPVDPPMN